MRKQFNSMAFALICMLTIASCSNDSLVATSSQKEVFKFKYQGVQYAAEYEIVDSTMMFTDPEISDIVCNLESDPYVATLTYPDGLVEYFDSNRDLEENIKKGEISYQAINSRAVIPSIISVTVIVYEHADFLGEYIYYSAPISIPDMANAYNYPLTGGPYDYKNFNDKISSFKMNGGASTSISGHKGAIITFYEDINYAYGSASFLIDGANPQISHSNFKKVKRCSYCKYNMNDRTSSIKLYWLD